MFFFNLNTLFFKMVLNKKIWIKKIKENCFYLLKKIKIHSSNIIIKIFKKKKIYVLFVLKKKILLCFNHQIVLVLIINVIHVLKNIKNVFIIKYDCFLIIFQYFLIYSLNNLFFNLNILLNKYLHNLIKSNLFQYK